MYTANLIGFSLAVGSSAFIGSSFIIKKMGLQRAGASGSRARSGGYNYLLEPLWWIGMATMIIGEFANFVAYMYAPAVLVTPLGALSIIVSSILAHFLLKEKLRKLGILGCILCVVSSTIIVLHAPAEHNISSVEEIWELAIQPAFLLYTASAVAVVLVFVLHCEPHCGQTNVMVYIGVCSIIGSLTIRDYASTRLNVYRTSVAYFLGYISSRPPKVSSNCTKHDHIRSLNTCSEPQSLLRRNAMLRPMCLLIFPVFPRAADFCMGRGVMSIKAIGIAIKLTLEGSSQVARFESWVFAMVAATCIITQLNYLNKALDTFNTAVVSPIYYAMFTSLTIFASAIMFKDWSGQSTSSIVSVLCGFITVLSGTMVLHSTRDPEKLPSTDYYTALSPQISWLVHANGEIWKQKDNDELHPEFVAFIQQDHFK